MPLIEQNSIWIETDYRSIQFEISNRNIHIKEFHEKPCIFISAANWTVMYTTKQSIPIYR